MWLSVRGTTVECVVLVGVAGCGRVREEAGNGEALPEPRWRGTWSS